MQFNQNVRIKEISIKATSLSHAPKKIKLVVNNTNLGFDEVQEAKEPQIAQTFELTEDQVTNGTRVELRFVRFQSVNTLTVSFDEP